MSHIAHLKQGGVDQTEKKILNQLYEHKVIQDVCILKSQIVQIYITSNISINVLDNYLLHIVCDASQHQRRHFICQLMTASLVLNCQMLKKISKIGDIFDK